MLCFNLVRKIIIGGKFERDVGRRRGDMRDCALRKEKWRE